MDRHLEVQHVDICTACQEVYEIVVVELLGANDQAMVETGIKPDNTYLKLTACFLEPFPKSFDLMISVVRVVDKVIKQQHTARGHVLVQQGQGINGTCRYACYTSYMVSENT